MTDQTTTSPRVPLRHEVQDKLSAMRYHLNDLEEMSRAMPDTQPDLIERSEHDEMAMLGSWVLELLDLEDSADVTASCARARRRLVAVMSSGADLSALSEPEPEPISEHVFEDIFAGVDPLEDEPELGIEPIVTHPTR